MVLGYHKILKILLITIFKSDSGTNNALFTSISTTIPTRVLLEFEILGPQAGAFLVWVIILFICMPIVVLDTIN
jgi:hypothetical protein